MELERFSSYKQSGRERALLVKAAFRQAVKYHQPLPEAVAVLKTFLRAFFILSLTEAAVFAQTSVNDVHVTPRGSSVLPATALVTSKLIGGSLLHVIKSDVNLVLVPQ